MIKTARGNLLDGVGCKVIPVNCAGAMGRGLAKQCADRYTHVYSLYRDALFRGDLRVGKPVLVDGGQFCLFATKNHWKYPSKLEWIEDGLRSFRDELINDCVKPILMPPLGCGLGGLEWLDVVNLIVHYLGGGGRPDVYLYVPKGEPDVRRQETEDSSA